jgi:CarD family transcriptional regulator
MTKAKHSEYAKGDFVVYPTHGVGKVLGVETENFSGLELDLVIIRFDKDRMTLRVPVNKTADSGLRKLSTRKVMDSALTTLKGRSRVKRTMWSRRAQEYEAKIPTASGRCTRQRSTAWPASWRLWSGSTKMPRRKSWNR